MRRLEGRTAVVTGGGTGIGRATAARLAQEGAHVFIAGRRDAKLREAAAAIGHDVTPVPVDITSPADVDRLYGVVRERGRGLDVLFANAAASGFSPLADLTEEAYDEIFDVNVKGTLLTVQRALPLLNKGASVVLNGSVGADQGVPTAGAYSASKAALTTFARTWASELLGRGIRVNVVAPGPIDTPGMEALVGPDQAEAFKAQMAAGVPLGRIGRPEEVAAAVAFLASDDSSFVLGTTLYVDGGMTQL